MGKRYKSDCMIAASLAKLRASFLINLLQSATIIVSGKVSAEESLDQLLAVTKMEEAVSLHNL